MFDIIWYLSKTENLNHFHKTSLQRAPFGMSDTLPSDKVQPAAALCLLIESGLTSMFVRPDYICSIIDPSWIAAHSKPRKKCVVDWFFNYITSPVRCKAITWPKCWRIVNWILRNKQWNSNQYTKLFLHEKAFENDTCEMAAILSRSRLLYINDMPPLRLFGAKPLC